MVLRMIATPQLYMSCCRTVCRETMGEGRIGDGGWLLRSKGVRRVSMIVISERAMYGPCDRSCIIGCCQWRMSMIQYVSEMLCGMKM